MVHAAPSIEPSIAEQACSLYVLTIPHSNQNPLNEAYMADQIVITEKTGQAKDVRSAVGSRYGDVLAAEGHLFDLLKSRKQANWPRSVPSMKLMNTSEANFDEVQILRVFVFCGQTSHRFRLRNKENYQIT
jgi:hypothetical protein